MADYREISQQYGQGAIKAAILVNGGAAVALMSQVAEITPVVNVKWALLVWAVGVLLAALAWPAAFLSTRYVDKSERETAFKAGHLRTSDMWMLIALGLICFSLAGFLLGSVLLANSFPYSAART